MKQQMIYASDIANYALCPRLVYNRKVLGIYTRSTSSQALGLFEHETRRRFYNLIQNHINEHTNVEGKAESFQSIAMQSIEETIPYVLLNYEFPHSIQKFKSSIASRLLKESSRIWKKVVSDYENIEYFVPFALEMSLRSARLRLSGRIDCLIHTVEGPIPVDFKTHGRNVEALPHELQITAYAMLVEEVFNFQVNHGVILYTEDNFSKIVGITPKHRLMVSNNINSILKMLETGKIPDLRHSLMGCALCDFSEVCSKGE